MHELSLIWASCVVPKLGSNLRRVLGVFRGIGDQSAHLLLQGPGSKGLSLSISRVTAEMCRQGSNGEEHPPRSPSWSGGAVLAQAGMWAAGQSSCLGEAGGDGFNNLFQAGRSKLLRAFPAQLWESLFPYWGNWWFGQNSGSCSDSTGADTLTWEHFVL